MTLQITNLSKRYPNGVHALNHLDLCLSKGMFGLLGPNGAGKSSLMRTIATLQAPDSGTISFDDIDVLGHPMELRKVLGYLPQDFGVYPGVSAEKLLDYFGTLKGIASKKDRRIIIDEVLELTNLYDVRDKSVSGYSGGMRQRFGIAQLLLNRPKLIIVDEPTAGLDPAERNRFLNVLREIGASNTVIFSTHIVEDVKDLCTDMAIMDHGCILKHMTPADSIEDIKGTIWTRKIEHQALDQCHQDFDVLSSQFNADHSVTVRVYANDFPGEGFVRAEPTLEDVYFITLADG